MANCRIAVAQLCSGSNLTTNFGIVRHLIAQAVENEARIVFFPEATDYIAPNAAVSRQLASQSPTHIAKLQKFIKKQQQPIDVCIGVHLPPNKNDFNYGDDRVKNSLLYIDSNGELINSYQKLHLFDVSVQNEAEFKESNSVQPGPNISNLIETPAGKLGSAICYDIRFPEMALKLRTQGADLICYPSAFTMKTGAAHWEILARARAIDTQCYVIMAAQQGVHDNSDATPTTGNNRESWGHSMVVNPWGKILSTTNKFDSEPHLIFAEIDLQELQSVRTKMPLWQQRRKDLFPGF